MTVQINLDFGDGDANITQEHGGQARLADALRASVDDMTNIRAQFAALLAKLDLDTGVTDENYGTTLALDSQTLVKG